MFVSSEDSTLGADFRELGEGDEFTWQQFHVKELGAQEFEGHTPVTLHNSTGRAVPLTWLLLGSQGTVDLITNEKMLMNIRTVQGKGAIRVHCNSNVKIFNSIGDLPRYGTVWYEPTGIANILSMSRVTKKFRVLFDSEGGNFSGCSSQTGKSGSVEP